MPRNSFPEILENNFESSIDGVVGKFLVDIDLSYIFCIVHVQGTSH